MTPKCIQTSISGRTADQQEEYVRTKSDGILQLTLEVKSKELPMTAARHRLLRMARRELRRRGML